MRKSLRMFALLMAASMLIWIAGCGEDEEEEEKGQSPEVIQHDEARDEAKILEIIDKQFEAFNRHDAEAVAFPAAENYENWDRSVKSKSAKIQEIEALFEEHPNIQGKRIKFSITFVTPDVAIYKDVAEFRNMVDEDGKTLPPDYELWAGVWVKKNGEWIEVASFCKEIEKADVEKSLN